MGFTTSYWQKERWSRRAADTLTGYGRCWNPSLGNWAVNWPPRVLFITQTHEWIDFRGTPRRHIKSHKRYATEQERDARHHSWIRCAYRKNHARHDFAECQNTQNADPESCYDRLDSVVHHHFQNVDALCPHRYTHADFVGTLAHRIGNDAVNSCEGQGQRSERKN